MEYYCTFDIINNAKLLLLLLLLLRPWNTVEECSLFWGVSVAMVMSP
jgi:hypothetical protein